MHGSQDSLILPGLSGLTTKSCMVSLDDVLVIGKTFAEHLAYLREVFKRLCDAGLRLKMTKCQFASSKVIYLGFAVSREGISSDPRRWQQ